MPRTVHAASVAPAPALEGQALVATPLVSIRNSQAASSSVHATPSVVGDSARKEVERRGTKQVNSSSAPSAAKAAEKALRAMPAATSASTRWMAVSWAWRRAHMASGDGAGKKVQHSRSGGAASSAAANAVHPSPNQPASASSAGHEPTMSSRSNFAISVRAPAT